MKELVDYSDHGNRTSDFKKIVDQANYATELQAENEALKAELSSVVAGLFSEAELNKIKADAIREAAIMPRWGGQPDDIPADFDGYCQAIHEMHEYANNLTKP